MNKREKFLELVGKGYKYYFDMKKKEIYVIFNNKTVTYISPDDKCEYCEGYDNVIDQIECMYHRYRHSIPSTRSERMKHNPFRFGALKFHELAEDDKSYGMNRDYALAELVSYIIFGVINNCITWDMFGNHNVFWKSRNFEQLIIMREWIE